MLTNEPIGLAFTRPQREFIETTSKFPAMVAGFGAGKTGALINRLAIKKLTLPENNVAYYLPTYDLVRTIAEPRFEEVLEQYGLRGGGRKPDFKILKADKMIKIEGHGSIIMRTMDNPGRIVGYEVAHSGVDELDTLKEKDARAVWQKILARNRQKIKGGGENTIAVATTPEGFRFVYKNWKANPPSEEYELIRASTMSNAMNLPPDYIDNLRADYPSNLIQAYIDGEFVNLTSGAVYPIFDRNLNGTFETLQPGDALHIGMDFNVGNMSAVVFVYRRGDPFAVAEIMKVLDTPHMIEAIKNRFHGHQIFVYPDASGASRKSNDASVSDIALLEQAGFNVCAEASNPAVKDRVLSVNCMIEAGGRRRLRVNAGLCPSFVESLEKQAYDDKGEPDKTSGYDHAADAGGYFLCYRFPVVSGRVQRAAISGT